MFEQVEVPDARGALVDWMLRGAVSAAFVAFGAEKFPSQPGSQWVSLFQQIGIGQWFRYFTGLVEIVGAVLVLIPRTAMIGIALLACTMAAAALILALVLGRPGDSPISAMFCVALVLFGLRRRIS